MCSSPGLLRSEGINYHSSMVTLIQADVVDRVLTSAICIKNYSSTSESFRISMDDITMLVVIRLIIRIGDNYAL